MHLDSRQSSEAHWNRLALFLSRDVVERRYRELHGGTLSREKALEVISHLEQGRQYFQSASLAGTLAGPLEQYYGVLAFARAVVLYRSAKSREATLKSGHGLKAIFHSEGTLGATCLQVTSGTFSDLLEVTENAEVVRIQEYSGRTWGLPTLPHVLHLPKPTLAGGAKCSFIDLLSRLPALRSDLEEALGVPARCYVARASLSSRTLSVSVVPGRFALPTAVELSKALGMSGPRQHWTVVGSVPYSTDLSFDVPDGTNIADCLPNIVECGWGQAVIERFHGAWALNTICTYFAIAHVMSMLVRYYPTRWARLLGHEHGDGFLPVLTRMRGLVQSEFVRLVLNELERPTD
jgi:hypothetical protein